MLLKDVGQRRDMTPLVSEDGHSGCCLRNGRGAGTLEVVRKMAAISMKHEETRTVRMGGRSEIHTALCQARWPQGQKNTMTLTCLLDGEADLGKSL